MRAKCVSCGCHRARPNFASRQNLFKLRGSIFIHATQVIDASSKNAFIYGGWASGLTIPINANDPSGKFAHVIFGAGVGAVAGFGLEAATQIAQSNFDPAKLVGSTLGGAVTGGVIAATGNLVGASVLGAATSNFTTQGIGVVNSVIAGGKVKNFDTVSLATDMAVSAVAGPMGAKLKIPGLTGGRGSYASVASQASTKLMNQTWQLTSLSASTQAKSVAVEITQGLPGQLLGSSVDYAKQLYNSGGTGLGAGSSQSNRIGASYPSSSSNSFLQRVYRK